MHGLGQRQGGDRLLHKGGGHLFGETQPGPVVPQDLAVCGGVQADAAVGSAGEGQRGGSGEKGQSQLGRQKVGQPVGSHGVRTGHRVIAVGGHPGQQMDEQLVSQAAGVGQSIDPLALGQGGVIQAHRSLVGDRPQEAQGDPAGPLRLPAGDLPDQDAVGPLGQLLGQRFGEQGGTLILHDLCRRPQAAVGPLVAALVARHAVHDLLPQGPQGFLVVAVPHVYVAFHHAGVFGLHHMGRRDRRTRDKGLEPAQLLSMAQNQSAVYLEMIS